MTYKDFEKYTSETKYKLILMEDYVRPSRVVYLIYRVVRKYIIFKHEILISVMSTKESAMNLIRENYYAQPFIIREHGVYDQ